MPLSKRVTVKKVKKKYFDDEFIKNVAAFLWIQINSNLIYYFFLTSLQTFFLQANILLDICESFFSKETWFQSDAIIDVCTTYQRSSFNYPNQGCREPIPATTGQRAGYTLVRLPMGQRANKERDI